jgi:acetyltransferase
MTTRNLDALFAPRAIALIGASNTPRSVGAVLARNLTESGFQGPVMAVNPHERAIRSALAYAAVADLPIAPDLAVIATPPPTIPGLVAELAQLGCRAAVVISAGFGEAGGAGADLRQQMLDAARPATLRIVGPNCLGVISPPSGVNASFAQLTPKPGPVALVAQSGAIATAALDWASGRDYGFSRVVTLGDMADVDFGDMLDFLALDEATAAVVLYVESVTDARKFMSAARAVGRAKPVAVIKAGRSAAGAKAALSHTGALAGADTVYDAAFRRAGMLRVFELRELFDAVTTLSSGLRVASDRLAIVSNGGGAGVLAVDALEARGGRVAELSQETLEALGRALPATWSKGDLVDIIGDAGPERYEAALGAVLADPNADAVLAINCPTAVADSTEAARAVIKAAAGRKPRPNLLTAWLGAAAPAEARAIFARAGVPTHETPDEAVRAFMHLADHARHQRLLMQVPGGAADRAGDKAAAAAVIDEALAQGREMLSDPQAKAVLAAYGVPVLATETAAAPAEAAAAARRLGGLVALKVLSPDITHKSDVGGVALNLGPGAVEAAAEAMLDRVKRLAPQARLDGFMVQAMADKPRAHELIAGLAVDPTFGPVVLFGAGGTAVEVLADRVIGLPPLNEPLAKDMIGRTRMARLLAGYRDRPPADESAIADVLVRLSTLAADLPAIAELDINPLLADEKGVLALDARIRITAKPAVRPAICPYPAELARTLEIAGDALELRAIRPNDALRLVDLVARSDSEDVRLRFRTGLKRLPEVWAARLSQIDYDREMALVAVDSAGAIVGVARLAGDPQGETAEFALMVRSDRQRQGLGHALMEALIGYARGRRYQRLWGSIARENKRMACLAGDLGFALETDEADVSLMRATLALT